MKTLLIDIKNKFIKYKNTNIVKRDTRFGILLNKNFEFEQHDNKYHIELILNWFLLAKKSSKDNGIPAKINLLDYIISNKVFYPSYPETTGYIIPSMINSFSYSNTVDEIHINEMIKFLLTIQNTNGGFNAHAGINNIEKKSYAFDTGQILCGLVSYYKNIEQSDDIKRAITNASNWMADNIEKDGSFTLNSCFNGKKAYYSRATIGLALSANLFDNNSWRDKVISQIGWIISQQNELGWYNHYSFSNGKWFNLHGISYTIRGILECGYLLNNNEFIGSAKLAVDKIIAINCKGLPYNSKLPNSFTVDYKEYDDELCLTGMAQFAIICFKLWKITKKDSYYKFAEELTTILKKVHFQNFDDENLNGLLSGSWPINGKYQTFDLPNWPIKFFLDCLMILEGLDPMKVEG